MSHLQALEKQSLLMDTLFSATIASLFSGVHQVFGTVRVQLSDILALVTILTALLVGFATPRVSRITLVVLLAYFFDYLLSALFVKPSMAALKAVQVTMVLSFLLVVFGYYRTRSSDRLVIVSTAFIVIILLFNIGWHVTHGFLVGWKHLNEPKTIFILMPLILILLFNRFPNFWRPPLPFAAGTISALIILLSGERKAYIFAPIALFLWIGPRRWWRYAIFPIAAIPALWIAGSADQNSYVHRQVNSLEILLSNEATTEIPDSQLMDANRPTTLSNAERVFTNRRAATMWKKQPLLGIGTNAFELKMDKETSIPPEFRLGIHGEFFRALYENGIIGLELYIAVWLVSLLCVAMTWSAAGRSGELALSKLKMLTLVMLLIYSTFESEKELMIYAICSLPFFVGMAPFRGHKKVRLVKSGRFEVENSLAGGKSLATST